MGKEIIQSSLKRQFGIADCGNAKLRCKLGKYLQAGAAGRGRGLRRGKDEQSAEMAMTLGYRPGQGDPFGAERQAVRGVFNVAAIDNLVVAGQQGGADGKVAVGAVAFCRCLTGGFFKAFSMGNFKRRHRFLWDGKGLSVYNL